LTFGHFDFNKTPLQIISKEVPRVNAEGFVANLELSHKMVADNPEAYLTDGALRLRCQYAFYSPPRRHLTETGKA
jgi:hypothetical protein